MAGVPGVPGGLLSWDILPGMSIESLVKQEPVDVLPPGGSGSLFQHFSPDGSSSMETTDQDLNDLLHSLSQEAVMAPAHHDQVNGFHAPAIQPDHMLGQIFNGFPLENGLEMPGISGMVNGVGSYSVSHRQERHNPLGGFPSLHDINSVTSHVGGFPSLPEVNSVTSHVGGFPSLPDVNSVTSHEGLDRLMSMVQRQSEALQSTTHNFSSLHQPAMDTSLSSNPHSSASATLASIASAHGTQTNNAAGTSHLNVPRMAQLTEPHTMRTLTEPSAHGGSGGGSSNPFHIDTSLIAAVPMAEQSAELQNLGLTVYNRDDIEQGIMAQVDQAIAEEEQERLKKILEKQLKAVTDDIKTVKQELANTSKVEKLIGPSPSDREAKRKLDAVKRQKENKIKQLKKLKAKRKLLTMKLDGNTEGLESEDEQLLAGDGEVALEEALGLGSHAKETERERMIRQGEMTPFGTVMPGAEQPQGPRLSTGGEMTSFEKYLMDQQQKGSSKKKQTTLKKSKSEAKKLDKLKSNEKSYKGAKKSNTKGASNNSKRTKLTKSYSSPALANGHGSDSDIEMASLSSGQPGDRPKGPNQFDAKDKRQYRPSERDFSNHRSSHARFPRLQHNFSGDRRLSDCEEYEDDDVYGHKDQEYVPHPDALMGDDSDYLSGHEQRASPSAKPKGQRKKMPRKRAAATFQVGDEVSSDEEEESTPKKKRGKSGAADSEDVSLKRTRDDGDFDTYKDRIRGWKKGRLKRKQEKAEAGETDSSDSEFENVDVDDGFKVPSKVWNNLYPYQRTCVRWLYELHGQQAGGIVGDEMGLGKTIQIISFLVGLRVSRLPDKGANTRYRGLGPTLIVCPATVMHQWVREFHKWWAPFRIGVLHNSGSYTSSVPQLIDDIASSHGVLVTSYASLTHNQDALLEYDWHYMVLDEGHKIRNPDAQVTVAAKRFRTCHRLILSGSPVQNNLKELWSLFDFIFPGKLGTLPDFMAHFSVPIVQGGYSTATQVQVQTAYKCACVLRDTINPYLLRRMKSDVRHNLSLPDKNEQVLFCRLTEEQRDVYLEYLSSKECGMILQGKFMVFPGLITLRKICNHPDLSTGGPQDFESAYREYAEGERQYGHHRRSGKMIVVRSLLQLWRKQGHRVLLFTQSRQMLLILEAFVQTEGYTYLKMDGGTTIAARQPLINKFNQDTSYFVFLLTTRVGGLGVNLTGANRIVIYDPDWNPSTDTQARERAWRIGQTKQVTIYRLLTAGTIEEKIYHRQIFKQFLTNRVLKDPKQRRLFKANDMYELFSLNEVGTSGSTETSAIFAGTGSDVTVKVPKEKKNGQTTVVKGKPNRFDIILEKKQKEKAVAEGEEEDEDCSVLADYMAATDTSKGQTKRVKADNKQKGTKKDKTKAAAGSTHQQELSNKEGRTDDTRGEGKDGEATGDGEEGAKDDRMKKMKELARKLSQQLGKGKGEGEEDKEKSNGEMTSSDVTKDQMTSRHKHKKSKHKDKRSKEKDQNKEADRDKDREKEKKENKHKSDKKHKKKKKKDAVFEGERIAHLSKSQTYVTPNDDDNDKGSSADQDSYVLARLLNKSGVHSALQHDKIMMSSDPDYALVEGEAERVAQEAARALRRSRQQCHSARSGVPTWTGQSSTAPPPKPRFGQKKNSKLLPAASVKKESPMKTSPEKKPELARSGSRVRHFDGTLAGSVQTDTGAPPGVMTSTQLLSRMKARNSLSIHDDGAEPASSQSGLSSSSAADIELITDIRNFIAFQSHVNGQASTHEIVDYFKKQVPTGSSPAFRAMLKQVCELHKRDGVGLWLLRPEFR